MRTETVSDTVHKLFLDNGKEIILIGTAHVSQNSVEQVKQIIEEETPDRICLELDSGRMKSKTDENAWENMDIRKVLKEGKGFLMLANTALASFQRRMGTQTGSKPGEEILGGATVAKEKGIPYSLCDREIQTTFKRAWRKSNLWNKCKLLATLISAVFSNEEISPEELESLKEQDVLQQMMNELASELPTVKEVLIDERDQYLATSIFQCEGEKKVAIIGAGHTNGIIATIEKLEKGEQTKTLEELSSVPKAKPFGKIIGYCIPIAIFALIAYGFMSAGWNQGLRLFGYWCAVNAGLTFITTLLSLAHPLNIIACTIAAPFTSLNPMIGVGIVGGVLEATFRKPKVKDFENLNDDATKFTHWYSNRILHALLVFFFSSIGSAIGTFAAFPVLISLLS